MPFKNRLSQLREFQIILRTLRRLDEDRLGARERVKNPPTRVRSHPNKKRINLLRGKTSPAMRFKWQAKVVLSKHERYTKGRVVNISNSGIFIETHKNVFRLHENVKLYIKPDDGGDAYTIIAKVIRFTSNGKNPPGYGLRFASPRKSTISYGAGAHTFTT